MILFIPYTRFSLKTYLRADEAEQRLAEHIESRKLRLGLSRDHKFFTGKIENRQFTINRIIHYRNSFLPVIIGQIHDDLNTSRIEITMRLSYLVIGFMALFIPFWAYMSFGYLISPVGISDWGPFILFFGFLLLFYGISMIFFNYEANKARRYLEEIFRENSENF